MAGVGVYSCMAGVGGTVVWLEWGYSCMAGVGGTVVLGSTVVVGY